MQFMIRVLIDLLYDQYRSLYQQKYLLLCMPQKEYTKHNEVYHTDFTCECGQVFELEAMLGIPPCDEKRFKLNTVFFALFGIFERDRIK